MTDNKSSRISCCIWTQENLTEKVLHDSLKCIIILDQHSHSSRKILQCKECGQLYLYLFEEEVDWEEGNDGQIYRWIPVENTHKAEELCSKSIPELIFLPSIRIDFSKEMKEPKGPYKVDFSS